MTIDSSENFVEMSNLCPFSRQIESYCESNRKKDPPDFLTEHFETCEKCRHQFIRFGKELERVEALIPKVVREDIKEEEVKIIKVWSQLIRKGKKRFFFF